jgi:GNAT superfamily N-acetyltransferase
MNRLSYRDKPVPSDRKIIREMVSSSGFFSPAEVEIAEELVEERLTKGVSSGYHFLFAEDDRRVVGYACFGPIPGTESGFDLYWIAVRPELRGTGVGKQILKEVEREIRGMGGSRIYADTSSRELYHPTHEFYRSCGFREEAVLKDFAKIIFVKILL